MPLFLTICQYLTTYCIGLPLSIVGTHHGQRIFGGIRFHRCFKKLCVQLLQHRCPSIDGVHIMHYCLWIPSHHISVRLPNTEIHRSLATVHLFLQGWQTDCHMTGFTKGKQPLNQAILQGRKPMESVHKDMALFHQWRLWQ